MNPVGAPPVLDDRDRADLARRGIDEPELLRQIDSLRRGRVFTRVDRPCTPEDGVARLTPDEQQACVESQREAAATGRFLKFVPASGAATRMFKDLIAALGEVDANATDAEGAAGAVERLAAELDRFPFADLLREAATDDGRGDATALAEALVGERGLGFHRLPKGLLPFHRDARGEVRTAFEEHLHEAIETIRDADGQCRLHFTVSPEHRARFLAHFAEVVARRGDEGVRFEIDWSEQDPSTDTVALDTGGGLARDADGRLLFRPGGHGALIGNLERLGADLVYVKNIDNVQPAAQAATTWHWKRVLGGRLVQLERERATLLGAAREGRADLDEVNDFLARVGRVAIASPDDVTAALDRPLRVCGVVENTGEPGGGPFFVKENGGATAQIVEAAQIDVRCETQREPLMSATHFNPVDLVCSLRRPDGTSYSLSEFIDPGAAIVATKGVAGRDRLVMERPGLWNGAMAGWLTAFVEVPLATFSPVKTIFDLLRPEHQG